MQHYSDEFFHIYPAATQILVAACSIKLEQRASGFHQTWVTYTEVLLIVHHAWIACFTWSFFHRKADIPADLSLQWDCSPLYRPVEICVLWLLFSVCIPESRHSLLCVQCTISTLHVGFPILPLQVEETAGNRCFASPYKSPSHELWCHQEFSPHSARVLLISHNYNSCGCDYLLDSCTHCTLSWPLFHYSSEEMNPEHIMFSWCLHLLGIQLMSPEAAPRGYFLLTSKTV